MSIPLTRDKIVLLQLQNRIPRLIQSYKQREYPPTMTDQDFYNFILDKIVGSIGMSEILIESHSENPNAAPLMETCKQTIKEYEDHRKELVNYNKNWRQHV